MSQPIRRIAISTGGGDAPGLNAVIRATVSAPPTAAGMCGIRDGFNGILQPENYPKGGVELLTRDRCAASPPGRHHPGHHQQGQPFQFPTRMPDGSMEETDRSDELLDYFKREGIDALVPLAATDAHDCQ